MRRFRNYFANESGISLIELLVATGLLAIVMTGITSMLISNMRAQQRIDAQFRSQLDVRQALYDIEGNLSEAKRKDASGNQPIFQNDMVSFPSQNGSKWITYFYTTPPGTSSNTIMRIISDVMPVLPITVSTLDHQMINVTADTGTTVDRIDSRPIFTYFGESGAQIIPDPVTLRIAVPRNVRSIQVSFQTNVNGGHGSVEPSQALTQIKLQNF